MKENNKMCPLIAIMRKGYEFEDNSCQQNNCMFYNESKEVCTISEQSPFFKKDN